MGKAGVLDVGCGFNPKGDINVDLFLEPSHREGRKAHAGKYCQEKNKITACARLRDSFELLFRKPQLTLLVRNQMTAICYVQRFIPSNTGHVLGES